MKKYLINRKNTQYFVIFLIVVLSIYLMRATQFVDASFLLTFVFFLLAIKISRYSNKISIPALTLAAFVLYLAWGIYAQVTPFSDFKSFYNQSVEFSRSGSFQVLYNSKKPMVTVYYSMVAYLLGESYLAFYIGASLIWSIQIPIFYRALKNFNIDKNKAAFVVLMYGLYPGHIFYASLLSSESVFNFFLICIVYLISKMRHGAFSNFDSLLFGLSCSLFYYTRSNSIMFIIPCLIIYFIAKKQSKYSYLLFGIMFVIPFLLQLGINLKYGNEVSINAHRISTYNFMIGTNRKTNGGYSRDDLLLAGFGGKDMVSPAEASRNAFNIACQRIFEDPIDFIRFALTEKMRRLWWTDRQNITWSSARSPKKDMIKMEVDVGVRILNAVYRMILISALLYLISTLLRFRTVYNDRALYSLITLTVIPMVLLALLHIFIEVQPRFHMPFLPFLIIFSSLFILDIPDYWHLIIRKFRFKSLRGVPAEEE